VLAVFDDPTRFGYFLLAAIAICLLPGSTVTNVMSTGLGRGFRAGLAAEAGAQLSRLIIILLVAIAVDAVTGAISEAFDWIKYVGAAYLIWLGIKFLRTPADLAPTGDVRRGGRGEAAAGLLIGLTNPKSYLFFGAFLPQFIDRTAPPGPQIVILGLIEMAIAAVSDIGYLWLVVTARQRLSPIVGRRLNQVAGVILIVAALWLALQHQA
jgi:threonine/homoserine/homoserine lactone efflux protein